MGIAEFSFINQVIILFVVIKFFKKGLKHLYYILPSNFMTGYRKLAFSL